MNRIRIREIVRKEFIQLFRDRKNRPILFVMPFIQLLIFAGADLKSMSATQSGNTSRPAYFCHFCESVPRRSGTWSKSNALIEPAANHECRRGHHS